MSKWKVGDYFWAPYMPGGIGSGPDGDDEPWDEGPRTPWIGRVDLIANERGVSASLICGETSAQTIDSGWAIGFAQMHPIPDALMPIIAALELTGEMPADAEQMMKDYNHG